NALQDGTQRFATLAIHGNASRKFEDQRIDRQRRAGRRMNLLHSAVALGAQHVLHLHGFDHRERLAGLDLLPFDHRDRDHQPRHRTQQLLAGVGRGDDRHQPRRRRFRFGEDIDRHFDALMREPNAVRNRAYLYRNDVAIDGALPNGIAGLPRRDQMMGIANRTIGAGETYGDAAVLARDIEDDLVAAEPHRAAALAPHEASVHLARNLPLALTHYMVDRRTDGGNPPRDLALRSLRRETLRKLQI